VNEQGRTADGAQAGAPARGRGVTPLSSAQLFVARCLRGIEWIAAAEVEGRGLGAVVGTGHREVRFSTAGVPPAEALRLRCADDVLLVCAEAPGLDHTRAALARLTEAARALPLAQALGVRQQILRAPPPAALTVVASFLGRRNYNRYDIEAAVAAGTAAGGAPPHVASADVRPGQAVATLRVHLVADRALFALRVFDQPLHRRPYRAATLPGALHPPLAAAMCLVAGLRPGARVLDPFAGVGTIAAEARALEPQVTCAASDVGADQVRAAAANLRAAGLTGEVARADAAALPFRDGVFDRVVSNPPWDLAVAAIGGREGALVTGSAAELARVMKRDGRAVLLVPGRGADSAALAAADAAALAGAGLAARLRSRVSLFGQHPELWLLAPAAAPSSPALDGEGPLGAALVRAFALAETLPCR
jgi:tRNA (guanine6-N2)-methyltransferase